MGGMLALATLVLGCGIQAAWAARPAADPPASPIPEDGPHVDVTYRCPLPFPLAWSQQGGCESEVPGALLTRGKNVLQVGVQQP